MTQSSRVVLEIEFLKKVKICSTVVSAAIFIVF